jgi:DNA-binding response OmpR family regulator
VSSLLEAGQGTTPGKDGVDGPEQTLQIGNVSVDLATFKAFVEVSPVNLTFQEFELLRYLADSRDRVVSFDALSSLLWGSPGPKHKRRLNVVVCRLRNKLRGSHPYRLETVRGRGYGLLSADEGIAVSENVGRNPLRPSSDNTKQ